MSPIVDDREAAAERCNLPARHGVQLGHAIATCFCGEPECLKAIAAHVDELARVREALQVAGEAAIVRRAFAVLSAAGGQTT